MLFFHSEQCDSGTPFSVSLCVAFWKPQQHSKRCSTSNPITVSVRSYGISFLYHYNVSVTAKRFVLDDLIDPVLVVGFIKLEN